MGMFGGSAGREARNAMRARLRQGRFLFPPFKGTYSFGTIRAVLLGCKLGGVALVMVASERLFAALRTHSLVDAGLGLLFLNAGLFVFVLPRKVEMIEEPGPA
ncbi:MAG: hypothetical protein QXO51_03040 [Halobacteria archaeon]